MAICTRPVLTAALAACLASVGLASVGLGGAAAWGQSAREPQDFARLRDRLVTEDIEGAGVKDRRVLDAMRRTPRHEFVPAASRKLAYFDMALPIGEEQTISPPFVVAYMTEKLDPRPTDKVLEIGTGSGYQAAVLSSLVRDVYTIEIEEKLGRRAKATLKKVGCKNVHAKIGDGYLGWPEEAPFDKIIVTCSPEKVPQPLIDQLKEGGRMIVPVGERFRQTLYLFVKTNGELESEALEPTMFVPMTGTAEDLRQVKPDLDHPALANGGFEESGQFAGRPDGWYYVRQAEVFADPAAPEGKNCLKFSNATPGRKAQALQAIGVDGRHVSRVDISTWVRAKDARGRVAGGPATARIDEQPRLLIQFFDQDRAPIGGGIVGPWEGTFDWREDRATIVVPREARLAIVAVGLLGGSGELCIDNVDVKAEAVNRSALPKK